MQTSVKKEGALGVKVKRGIGGVGKHTTIEEPSCFGTKRRKGSGGQRVA